MQTAWNYMNDSLRTEVFVRFDPETIACACIYLSARLLQIPLPNKPAWYLVFGISEQDINDICHIILSLYTRKKPDPEKLERIVDELRKSHLEAKLKAKGLAAQNNQTNLSPASQACSPRNGTKSPVSEVKKEKTDYKHNEGSPKYSKEMNHRKRRSSSPLDDDYQSSEGKKRTKTSSSGSATSHSPSPKRKQKTPPRGFKDSRHSRSRSRSKTRSSKKTKHRSSHKRKHSHSLSPSPVHHNSKKSYKSKHSDKSHHTRSRSRSHERNHHSNALHEKAHKSRKDKTKESRHSQEKKRRIKAFL